MKTCLKFNTIIYKVYPVSVLIYSENFVMLVREIIYYKDILFIIWPMSGVASGTHSIYAETIDRAIPVANTGVSATVTVNK